MFDLFALGLAVVTYVSFVRGIDATYLFSAAGDGLGAFFLV